MNADVPPAGEVPAKFEPNLEAEAFYAGAEARSFRFLAILSGVATILLALRYGAVVALGFVLGSAVSAVNLLWLKRVATGFSAAVVNDSRRPSGARLAFRYLVRFALITFVAFAIFKSSRSSGYGFLAGLFVSVAALMCEAAYEAWVAVRRKL